MSSSPRFIMAAALLGAAACAAPVATTRQATTPITSAETLIRAMHDRYAGRWYRSMSFTQQTTRILPNDSTTVETWREWGVVPGRLRIEIGPRESGRGVIFADDSLYIIRGDTVEARIAQRNPLLVLGFDVYGQPPERTLQVLREEKFDLEPFRADSLDGRPMYVFGTVAADRNSREVWVDAERLVFVRMIESTPQAPAKRSETRFNAYRRAGGGWIAPEVEVLVDGRRVFHEAYSDVRVDIPVDSVMFDPERWRQATGR